MTITLTVDIDSEAGKRLIGDKLKRALQLSIDKIAVAQLEQVDTAFRDGGQPILKWPRLWADKVPGHYRSGGQPLVDTTQLSTSFGPPTTQVFEKSATSTISSGVPYAAFHQTGFQTIGPNFIPLNQTAARLHEKGRNPKEEGLVRGVDYIMAFKGVTVPARPMIDYEDPINKKQIDEAVIDGLQASFSGG